MSSPRRSSLVVIFLTVFIDLIGFGMVLPLLPTYADQFTVDEAGWLLGLLMAVFSIMQFLFAPLWGRLSDRIGRRPVLMIGLAGSVVFYTLFGIATVMQSIALLFVSRIGAGISGATISTAQAYIADSTSLAERPRGMALIGMAFGLGFTFGPVFAYLAVPEGGDAGPGPGYAAAALSAIALVLAYFKLPESLHPDSQPAGRKFSFKALRESLSVPSIGLILSAIFVCVFSLAVFETTLGLLIKGKTNTPGPFDFGWKAICLTYAYVGFVLMLVQGGIVRRIARRVSEIAMALAGAVIELFGFGLMIWSIHCGCVSVLFAALTVVTGGFAFIQPSLNSVLSRRSDPARQGGILGIGQSVSALARICGSLVGIPLLRLALTAPFYTAGSLMVFALLVVLLAGRRGGDFAE